MEFFIHSGYEPDDNHYDRLHKSMYRIANLSKLAWTDKENIRATFERINKLATEALEDYNHGMDANTTNIRPF